MMNTNQLFDIYASYVWPLMRPFIRKTKRCKSCILSERYTLLKDGICEFCLNYKEKIGVVSFSKAAHFNELKLKNIIHENITNARYHAIILLSGGKDSAYVLDRLKFEFPDFRILAVVINNGFMSPFAIKNASYISEKLNIDLVVHNSAVENFNSELKKAFLSLKGRGAAGVVDHTDGTLIFKTGQQLARELNIPLMLSGLSWVQVEQIVGIDNFELTEMDGVRQIFPLAVWKTDEQDIRAYVREKKLMIIGTDSPIVSNSELVVAMSILDIKNLGYSSFEPEFAQLIREKKTSRKTWLHLFELLEFATRFGFLNKDFKRSLSKLNIDIKELMEK